MSWDIARLTSKIAVLFQITIKMTIKLEELQGSGQPQSLPIIEGGRRSADVRKIRAEN